MEASSSFAARLDIPATWRRLAADIIRHQWRKVLILGHVDTGKSTFCAFLSQQILAAHFVAAIVDADIGQKDIGPPSTITMSYPTGNPSLADLQPAALYFVGAISPAKRLLPMVVGSKQLVDAAQSDFILINTTGFIHGAGRILKHYKIEALQPDIIVALERNSELRSITHAYRNYRIKRLRPSLQAVSKTPQDRLAARQRAFATYFSSAQEVTIPHDRLIFQRSIVRQTLEKHLLCGVADRHNRGLGLAIVTEAKVDKGYLSLFTPVPAPDIRVLQGGDFHLRPACLALSLLQPR
jgi:polynucleotide 5'-hydroxyl-kinase GRC3/NOL9